jgi:NAD(P)-dependent dehydrogenase (short-subunit alcohol dehydrogenase family)
MGIMEKFSLKKKRAFVTGGASGIGKCACETLAECGADVAVIDINADGAKAVADELHSRFGVRTLGIAADITDKKQVDAMIKRICDVFGGLDIAFNNAGIAKHQPIEELTEDTFDTVLSVNLKGTLLTAQAAARVMIAQKTGGSIINTVSICGHIINRPQKSSAYCISKGGLLQMTRAMAVEWAPYNIRVNSISPGYVYTNIIKGSPNVPIWEDLTPMKRLAHAEEMMGALIYLASDASSYTTGCDILVDGGYTCW